MTIPRSEARLCERALPPRALVRRHVRLVRVREDTRALHALLLTPCSHAARKRLELTPSSVDFSIFGGHVPVAQIIR